LLSERVFEGMHRAYDRTLRMVMRHQRTTLIFSLVILGATVVLFRVIPKGFFPSEDTGQIFGITEAAQGISFDAMKEHQLAVARVGSADTKRANFTSSIGVGGSTVSANSGRFFMRLKPRSQRQLNVDQIIQDLRPKRAGVPGIQVFLKTPPLI